MLKKTNRPFFTTLTLLAALALLRRSSLIRAASTSHTQLSFITVCPTKHSLNQHVERPVLPPNPIRAAGVITRLGFNLNLDSLLFGDDVPTSDDGKAKDDPEQVFVHLTNLASSTNDAHLAHKSLSSYLLQWSSLLSQGSQGADVPGGVGRGLKTPVSAEIYPPLRSRLEIVSDDNEDTLETTSGVKIMFRPPKRYLSYKEQKGLEKGVMPDRKGGKIDAWSPGGVLVLVEMVEVKGETQVQLVAKRCEIDGDTVIKFDSERAIVKNLKKAVRIWRDARSSVT